MADNALQSFFSAIKNTPFHPQWFAVRKEKQCLIAIGARVSGWVLDIGCAQQKPRRYLNRNTAYIGLDHYQTATERYGTRPHVYGDARLLPFQEASFDWVLLLDVLEHIPEPQMCMAEIFRVLKPKGRLIVQVPFLYPIHDAPLDFHRWTLYGLQTLAKKSGFAVVEKTPLGTPLASAALASNIAFSKAVLDWLKRKSLLSMLILVLPLFVLCSNLLAWMLSPRPDEEDGFMPYAYRMVLEKQ